MKVSELPYRRVTLEEIQSVMEDVIARTRSAKSVEEVLEARGVMVEALPDSDWSVSEGTAPLADKYRRADPVEAGIIAACAVFGSSCDRRIIYCDRCAVRYKYCVFIGTR